MKNNAKGFGFGPTKEESLELISDLLISTLVTHYQNNMGGLNRMMQDLSPKLDKRLADIVRQNSPSVRAGGN